jgi:hypothetical protein
MKKQLINNYAVVLTAPVTVINSPTSVFTDENIEIISFDTEDLFLQYIKENNIDYDPST